LIIKLVDMIVIVYYVSMYVARVPNRKSPPAFLVRESYRVGKQVRSRTIVNISSWKPDRIEALRRALAGEFDNASQGEQGWISDRILGVLFVLKKISDRIGVSGALGSTRLGLLSLFLVLSRVAAPASRLASVRWAANHAVDEVLGLHSFDEDDLYEALDFLAERQKKIEDILFRRYVKERGSPVTLVLYDVTSSYFEGTKNELAAFGYNRDGKRGKLQIVIGLLAGPDGEPLAIRVFRGNTCDPATVADQVTVLKERFGIQEVVFVGDRGMVKTSGKERLREENFRYITALTDPQIRKLLRENVLQMGLFDEAVQEASHGNLRIVLRRNEAVRRKEMHRRDDKLARIRVLIDRRNKKLADSKRAKPESGLKLLRKWIGSHKLTSFAEIQAEGRTLHLLVDEAEKSQDALLDGCYALETDVTKGLMDAATVDARYRDLQKVERDFRTVKTTLLDVRPLFLRKESRTRGAVFVTMLALKIARELQSRIKIAYGTTDDDPHGMTVTDALEAFARLSFQRQEGAGRLVLRLPKPDEMQTRILEAIDLRAPRPGIWKSKEM